MEVTRREFVSACIAAMGIGVLSIAWDAVVNEGHPARTDEPSEDGGEEPP